MNRIFIIVLHFGDPKVTQRCLQSIFQSKLTFQGLVIVDNGGNFESRDKRITIIKNKKNLGFAGGVNVGIKYALSNGADYVLLLNNDTLVEDNFLDKLIDFSEESIQVGIVGPAIKFKIGDKVVYDIGGKFNKVFGRTSHEEVSKVVSKTPRRVDYVSGCAMLIKKEIFDKIGFFDGRFFLYYEDVDFCIRARNKGFFTYVLPGIFIEHELSTSIGKVSSLAVYHQTKSGIQFGKKHFKDRLFLNRAFIVAQTLYILVKNPKVGISSISAFKYL